MILQDCGAAKERANVVQKALIHEAGRRGAEIPQFFIEGRPSLCGDPAEGVSESKKKSRHQAALLHSPIAIFEQNI